MSGALPGVATWFPVALIENCKENGRRETTLRFTGGRNSGNFTSSVNKVNIGTVS